MKKLLTISKYVLLVVILFFTCFSFAQTFTTVSGTIVDSDNITWINGGWSATLQNPRGGQVTFIATGQPVTVTSLAGPLNNSGAFNQSGFAQNDQINPAGTSWQFKFCPNASFQCTVLPNITFVTGQSSFDISASAHTTIQPPRFPALGTGYYGYSDVEISSTPIPGGFYFNVVSGAIRYWNGSQFIALTATPTQVSVNSNAIASPNFNNTTPTAPGGFTNILWQFSGNSISGYYQATSGGTNNLPICSDISGSGTTQSCTTSPTFIPAAGICISYATTTANTGTNLTLNVNGSGLRNVTKWQGNPVLATGDIAANKPVTACYDGSNWNVSTIANSPTFSLPSSVVALATNSSGGAIAATAVGIGGLWSNCSPTNPFMAYGGTCNSSSAATQRGIDATVVGGLSAAASDNATTWLNMLAGNCQNAACDVYIPCGSYNFVGDDKIVMTSGNYTGMVIEGEGRAPYLGKACVQFNVLTPGNHGMWLDNASVGAGNQGGPDIRNIMFVDKTTASACNTTYGANAVANHPSGVNSGGCAAQAFRITQINSGMLHNVTAQGFLGITDWNGANNGAGTGTITVTNGSTAFSCSACTFTTAMVFGRLWVNGVFQEINSISGSTGNFTSKWEFPTATTTNWNVDYNGVDKMFESTSISGCTSGSDCFTQYWDIYDSFGWGNTVEFDFVGGPTACTQGNSRFNIYGPGQINGEHTGDNIGFILEKCTDTIDADVAMNSYAVFADITNSHANNMKNKFENSSSVVAPIYTCNNGVGLQSCTIGYLVNCETAGECHDNKWEGGYVYTVGNGFQFAGTTNVSGDQIIGMRMRSNTHNFVFDSGSCNTQTATDIIQPDCLAFQAPVLSMQGTNMLQVGSGAPSGSCTDGLYINTTGGSGSSIYGCRAGVWVNIL